MSSGKLKRPRPRDPSDEEPPSPRQRRRPRLASEPTSRRQKLTDRWEDGFLRLGGTTSGHPLSFVVDGLGIYYDATSQSELEYLLEAGGWERDDLLARAEYGMAELRARELSLDNDPRRVTLDEALGRLRKGSAPASGTRRKRIVVIDQPRGDSSIGFGLAGAERFPAMLDQAIAENPGAEIVVLRDPASRRPEIAGHLEHVAAARGAILVAEPVQAWSVVESCDHLYVVASHIGFEAAIADRKVTCFGMPFYAGWGFTDDRLKLARRTRPRDVREVFAAAYLVYSRYYEPYGGGPSTFEESLEILTLIERQARENAVATICLGFSAWKRRWLMRCLGAAGHGPILSRKLHVSAHDLEPFGRAVAWSSRAPDGVEEAAAKAGVPFWRMEDGFLRSIGLGVGLRPGASFVLDRTGIYYDSTRPNDLETLLQGQAFDDELTYRAARLRAEIVAAGLSKYNVGAAQPPKLGRDKRVVLVAGQVENDASIRLGSPDVATNAELLRRARARHPDAYLVFKPHPDVEAGLRPGRMAAADLAAADLVLRDVAAPDAIALADHVEVMTSLIGFEALLRGKSVRTHGMPFYAGWGLTDDPGSPRRTRRLTLDELVAGALILYPRYIDPRTGLPCPVEVLVRRMMAGDPGLGRRERTLEALLKGVWSMAVRRTQRG